MFLLCLFLLQEETNTRQNEGDSTIEWFYPPSLRSDGTSFAIHIRLLVADDTV